MSLVSPLATGPWHEHSWQAPEKGSLLRRLLQAGRFLGSVRDQLRFGELSRAPLQLIRFHMEGDTVECDWIARGPDPWDRHVSRRVQLRHSTLQTLADAIRVRTLVFNAIPGAETAYFRVYREVADRAPELILTGCAQRNDNLAREVHSLVMRAKVLGFKFRLEGDMLSRI
ncbi:MAG TPA: hypothetical protein VN151_09995 [Terracidiphilus sp.]|nr:hypothetical protein [Terracidiphilus sp.]